MQLEYQCTLDDYREAMDTYFRGTVGYYVLLVGGVASLLFAAFTAYEHQFVVGKPLLYLGILWLGWLWVGRPWWVRRDFRKHPNFSAARKVEINDEGIRWSSELTDGNMKWPAFAKFRETPKIFLLRAGARTLHVLPKHAMSDAQVAELRSILQSKFPGK